MRQSLAIFWRDIVRLLRVPKTWVIIIGLIFTPALYSWVNISAFWDPYGNTSDISVAVVNEDKGASTEITGKVAIGDNVVEQLKNNHDLGWQFLSRDEAEDKLIHGKLYASIVIPESFSSDLLSMFSGTFTQPTLEYHPNEKISAVGPMITDTGAQGLNTQITSVFRESIAHAATQQLRDAGVDLDKQLDEAKANTNSAFDRTESALTSARDAVGKMQDNIASTRPALTQTRSSLDSINSTLNNSAASIGDIQTSITKLNSSLSEVTDDMSSALVDATGALVDTTTDANATISTVSGTVQQASRRLEEGITTIDTVLAEGDKALATLHTAADNASLSPDLKATITKSIDEISQRQQSNHDIADNLRQTNSQASALAASVATSAEAFNNASHDSYNLAKELRHDATSANPKLTQSLNKAAVTTQSIGNAINLQRTALSQASQLLASADSQLDRTNGVLNLFKGDLSTLIDGVRTAHTDILAINSTVESGPLNSVTSLDADNIGKFMASPVKVVDEKVFPVKSYGSAMAALFTSLALWIGVFMLMVIFRVEVDTEGLGKVSIAEAYFGRFFLLATVGFIQALVVSTGDLIIGVQTVNPLAFITTSIINGFFYLCIIYGLVSSLGHAGRGLAILLVIIQIPGASGLYPIELMPDFFRSIYPWMPFSYGIDALRETIGGFYSNHYLKFMGIQCAMALTSLVVGLILRRWLSHFKLLFNKEIDSTGLLASDEVQVTGSGYRLTDVIHALQSRSDFAEDLSHRWEALRKNHDKLISIAAIVGVLGMVALGAVSWFLPTEKSTILGAACLWLFVILGFIGTVEYLKRSYEHSATLASLNEEDLRAYAVAANGMIDSTSGKAHE